MPPRASTVAEGVDNVFYFIYYLSVFFFVVIVALMVVFAVKYRKRSEGQRSSPIKGHLGLELLWSVVPAFLLVAIFLWGFFGFMDLSVPPDDALDIRVTAQQWSWNFSYPRDGINSPDLVVPAGRPVKLTMSSNDVIHSFFVPDFRVKRDVLPNRYTVLWFEAIEPGEHNIFCTEYCGTSHAQMLAKVKVLDAAAYQEWIQTGGGQFAGDMPMHEIGKSIFTKRGCIACHSVDGTRLIGPSLKGVYGHEVQLADGSTVKADDNYLRESIMDPATRIVTGYQPVMPTYRGMLADKEVDALIEYVKSLAGTEAAAGTGEH
ncbi:cytochrome c oxidase subunit II [bacterium]|nr:cytochrome c oxidase subunit II [bacterium]